jgi:hypothetical protein
MTLLIALLIGSTALADKPAQDIERIQQHLQRHLGPKAVNPKLLAPAIYQIAREYNIPQDLLVRIIVVESRGLEHAVNNKSKDYGLFQINIKNGDVAKIACAMKWQCAIHLAAEILSKTNRTCAYNTGNRGSKLYPKTCEAYERKIASIN